MQGYCHLWVRLGSSRRARHHYTQINNELRLPDPTTATVVEHVQSTVLTIKVDCDKKGAQRRVSGVRQPPPTLSPLLPWIATVTTARMFRAVQRLLFRQVDARSDERTARTVRVL